MSEINIKPVTRNTRFRLRPDDLPVQDPPWTYPLPRLGGAAPRITGRVEGDRRILELGFDPAEVGELKYVPVYAVQSGRISLAIPTATGHAISIDHGGWSSHYANLSHRYATVPGNRKIGRTQVRAGDAIGFAACSPVHIRFELWDWTEKRGFVQVDPSARMKDWRVLAPSYPSPSRLAVVDKLAA